MNNTVEALIKFCKEADRLVCYGIGNWAGILTHSLREMGICIDVYCISDDEALPVEQCYGRPVYHNSEIDWQEGTRLLLGLREDYQDEVIPNLSLPLQFIFRTNFALIKQLEVNNKILGSIIYNLPDIQPKPEDVPKYERKIKEIMQCFDVIEVRMRPSALIGSYVYEWIYFDKWAKLKKNHFYLFNTWDYEGGWYAHDYHSPNKYLLKKFAEHNRADVTLETLPFWKYFITYYPECFEGHIDSLMFENALKKTREKNFFVRNEEFVRFTDEEKSHGENELANIGITGDFVCVFSRDPGFYQATEYKLFEDKERDDERLIQGQLRNSRIENLEAASVYLKEQGMQSVRIGSHPEVPVPVDSNIIDYGRKYHSYFMDVYLAYRCKFYLGDNSGVACFYHLFSKPLATVNQPVFLVFGDYPAMYDFQRDIYIPKKFWYKSEERFLNLSEILQITIKSLRKLEKNHGKVTNGLSLTAMAMAEMGVEFIDNTPEEIRDLAMEMKERLDGHAVYTAEDEARQRRVREIIEFYAQSSDKLTVYQASIGREFLRQNDWLLK